jgi:hypothetical protein
VAQIVQGLGFAVQNLVVVPAIRYQTVINACYSADEAQRKGYW